MDWLTDDLREKLLENGRRIAAAKAKGEVYDPVPHAYVRLYGPKGCAWLIFSLRPDDPDLAEALCQPLGEKPRLGTVRLSELAKLRGVKNTGVCEDPMFKSADRLKLSEYMDMAKYTGQITLQFTDSGQG